jgi:hypothetical protein
MKGKENKHPPIKLKSKGLPTNFGEKKVEVTQLNGMRDRITVSFGADLEIKKYEKRAKVFFTYSTDVGMYDKKETLAEAIKRADNVVSKKVKADIDGLLAKRKTTTK